MRTIAGVHETRTYYGYVTPEDLFGDMTSPEGIASYMGCDDVRGEATRVLADDWTALAAWIAGNVFDIYLHDVRDGSERSVSGVYDLNGNLTDAAEDMLPLPA